MISEMARKGSVKQVSYTFNLFIYSANTLASSQPCSTYLPRLPCSPFCRASGWLKMRWHCIECRQCNATKAEGEVTLVVNVQCRGHVKQIIRPTCGVISNEPMQSCWTY